MKGINEKDMQAVINSYDLKAYYYPTLFPLKEIYSLTWKTIEAQSGLKIAADLVSRGTVLGKKTREAVARISGDIPKIGISRDKNEEALNEYDLMIAMSSGNPDIKALVEFWAEDTKFCWDGIANRLEWIALRQLSLGKIQFTNANNNAVVTEYDIDYQIPSGQKVGFQTGSSSWDTTNTAKPISKDFKAIVQAGQALGLNLKFAFMSQNTFAKFVQIEEVIKLCATFANNALQISQSPDLATVNGALARNPFLGQIQIVVIDQLITLEKEDGTRVITNPFEDDVVTFTEGKVQGATYWKRPIDLTLQGSVAIKSLSGHTLIKKYSTESPVAEITEGIANAFPAWLSSGRSILMQTNASSWSK